MRYIFAPFLILFILTGCHKKDCTSIGPVAIVNAMIPDTVLNQQNVPLRIKAIGASLCWSDLYVELKEEAPLQYSLNAFGTFTCCDGFCACPTSVIYKDTTVYFKPSQPGTYLFLISYSINNVDIDTMIVK